MEPDGYQRPPGTPEPEGGTNSRSPYPGWLRSNAAGMRINPRTFKMIVLLHQLGKRQTK